MRFLLKIAGPGWADTVWMDNVKEVTADEIQRAVRDVTQARDYKGKVTVTVADFLGEEPHAD